MIPGQELAGVVTALGYGTTGLSVGQRVFGLSDSYRGGTLAEYVAVEARNLAPLPGDVDSWLSWRLDADFPRNRERLYWRTLSVRVPVDSTVLKFTYSSSHPKVALGIGIRAYRRLLSEERRS